MTLTIKIALQKILIRYNITLFNFKWNLKLKRNWNNVPNYYTIKIKPNLFNEYVIQKYNYVLNLTLINY